MPRPVLFFKLSSIARNNGCHRKEPAVPVQALSEISRDYFGLFVNRRAYTVKWTRPDPETGRHYYHRTMAKGTGEPLGPTYETLRHHLEGQITIALHAINPSTLGYKVWREIMAGVEDSP